jgi:hypothetical protein
MQRTQQISFTQFDHFVKAALFILRNVTLKNERKNQHDIQEERLSQKKDREKEN